MRLPLKEGILQGDFDANGFRILNLPSDSSATYNVKDHGLVGDGVTDDTAALQALVNLVVTNGGGTIFFPDDGPYIIAGPLQDTSYRNAQIILPTVTIPNRYPSIMFKGYVKPSFGPAPLGSASHTPMPNGTIIKSTLASGSGTRPAVINGRGDSGSAFDESDALWTSFQDLTFQTVANPSYSCLNFQHLTYLSLRDVSVIAGSDLTEDFVSEPMTSTSYGIILPDNSRTLGLDLAGNVNVLGFYNGFRWGELTLAKQINACFCKVGIEFNFAYHSTMIQRYLAYHCARGSVFNDVHPVCVLQWDTERQAGGHWNSPVYDIDDAGNKGSGDVTWLTVLANTGRISTFTKNGGTGIKTRELGS